MAELELKFARVYEKVRLKSRLPNWRIRDQSTAVEKEEEEPGVANLLPRPSFGGDEQPTAWLGEEWSELVSSLSLALILSGLEEGRRRTEKEERGPFLFLFSPHCYQNQLPLLFSATQMEVLISFALMIFRWRSGSGRQAPPRAKSGGGGGGGGAAGSSVQERGKRNEGRGNLVVFSLQSSGRTK